MGIFVKMFNKELLGLAVKQSSKSKEEIASEADITLQTLYSYIGGRRDPNSRTIALLAKALDKTAGYFFGETEGVTSSQNFRVRSGGGLADPDLMVLLEKQLEVLTKLIHETEKKIRSNSGSGDEHASGN